MQRLIDVNKLIYERCDDSAIRATFDAETVLTIPNNATNGDMIIALYPNLRYVIQNGRVMTTIGVATSFDLDWWNAPYEREIG